MEKAQLNTSQLVDAESLACARRDIAGRYGDVSRPFPVPGMTTGSATSDPPAAGNRRIAR